MNLAEIIENTIVDYAYDIESTTLKIFRARLKQAAKEIEYMYESANNSSKISGS